MQLGIKRGLSAAVALAALAGLMIHASATTGCGASAPVAAPDAPVDGQASSAPAAPTTPPPSEETFLPASKAGPMYPHKSAAPPAQQQNAAPQK